nr:hypothetical protein [uncultured Pedobacter sp.]
MNIQFNISKFGSYGGGLNRPFQWLGRIISDHITSDGLKSTFSEIEIIFTYPLMNKKGEDELVYKNWFSKLPSTKFTKNRTIVKVTIPFCDAHLKVLPMGLDNIFQETVKAFELIRIKKKQDDIFETSKILASLTVLQKQLKLENLESINQKYELQLNEEIVKKNKQNRINRKSANAELDRLIKDIRIYHHFESINRYCFSPYDQEFIKEILVRLRDKKFKLPGYTHIYIMVSDSPQNALLHSIVTLPWYEYGVAVLENPELYIKKSEKEKKMIVFNLLKDGLTDIAKTDKLDLKALNKVLHEIDKCAFASYI